jgi:hypothetical protein
MTVRVIVRWACAIVFAGLVYIVVRILGALVWKQFGTNPATTIQWSILVATALAAILGATTVPRLQRQTAALAIWALTLLIPVGALIQNVFVGDVRSLNVIELFATMGGGFIGFYATRVGNLGRKINRVSGQN